jgi:hypothetical protein
VLPSEQRLTLSLLPTVTLEVVPLRTYAPFPALLPLFKCILQVLFCEGVQHRLRFCLCTSTQPRGMLYTDSQDMLVLTVVQIHHQSQKFWIPLHAFVCVRARAPMLVRACVCVCACVRACLSVCLSEEVVTYFTIQKIFSDTEIMKCDPIIYC